MRRCNLNRLGAAGILLTLNLSTAFAEYCVPLTATPPIIDGKIDAAEWANGAAFDGFVNSDTKQLQRRRVRGYVSATADTIYVAIQSQLPDEGQLLAVVTADSMKVIYDDTIEVYVDPTPGAANRVDYQFLLNSIGKCGYNVHLSGAAQESVNWQGNWKHASGQHDGWWHVECAIPIGSMSTVTTGRRTIDGAWGINLTRNWRPDWQWSSLSGGYAHAGERFTFTDQPAPAAQFSWSGDPSLPPVEGTLKLTNPTDRPLSLKAALHCVRNNMPELQDDKAFVLTPRSNAVLRISIPDNDPTTRYALSARVESNDGKAVYYARSNAWVRARTPFHWVQGPPPEIPPLDLRFAYYPSKNSLRVLADISGLGTNATPRQVEAIVRSKRSHDVVKRILFPLTEFVDGRQERTVALPRLSGEYEVALTLAGAGVPTGAVVRTFTRQVFPWEQTALGTSTTVYPPFTPLKLDGRALRAVLRTHTLNDSGLLDQVTGESANTGIAKPLLAGPMRYVAHVAGAAAPVEAGALHVVSAKDNAVITTGKFHAGVLNATWTNTWDYDGTLRVDLTLDGSSDQAVDNLTLEIPLRADMATHLHANSDRIRAPIVEALPQKDGVAWDARRLACDDYIKNFCPYVFLGNPVRGLCWFAENDGGWGWDPSTPNMEVERRGDIVLLRVHLINQPTIITAPRTLTFGLLAAPVKPPYNLAGENPNWWRYRYYRDKYNLLGTDINWFALGDCGSVYPAGCDMYLWKMLARGNREHLDDAAIAAFVDYGRKYFTPYGPAQVERWESHARGNLRSRFGNKMIFYYNRASCQVFDEFETFKDEWTLDDLRTVEKGNGIGEIKVVPTPSFIDYNLYWYAKSFELGGNRGVYWDNYFIAPSFNTGTTAAYRRPDGAIVPAAGLWGLRELAKRTFIMMNERNMPPITFPHMTSFSPLPLLSFATVQYDWEWKYSEGDVQDRFSPEYLTLVSAGELAGVWPVPLHEHGAQENDQWIQRTFTAVRLIHELDGFGGFGFNGWSDVHKQNLILAQPVLDLLDRPGLQVYKYWEDRPQPVRAVTDNCRTIVYSVPGVEAAVVAVSYAQADQDVMLNVDAKALGFIRGWTATNVETNRPLTATKDGVTLHLKKHDVCVLRLAPVP